MMINGDATIFNRWEEDGKALALPTRLPGVFWSMSQEGGYPGHRYSNKRLERKNKAKILVPAVWGEKQYISPSAWKGLSRADKERFFTFAVGDIILQEQWVGDEAVLLTELLAEKDDAICLEKVHSVMAPHGLSHWELEGV